MQDAANSLASALLSTDSLRTGPDFFAGESASVLVLDLLFNQMIGVERATAVNLAIHAHLAPEVFSNTTRRVGDVSDWPYTGQTLRAAAKGVASKINEFDEWHLPQNPIDTQLSDLPPGIIGALASLERYLNRENRFFDPLRKLELKSNELRSISADELFRKIRPLTLYPKVAPKQLASAVSILEMNERGVDCATDELRKRLLALERVGEETADTLLVYLFSRPAVVVDTYLKRIGYRHFGLPAEDYSNKRTRKLFSPYVKTADEAHRIHVRADEIGVDKCFAKNPDCDTCPLSYLPRRI